MRISDLAEWVGNLDEPSVAPLVDSLTGEHLAADVDGNHQGTQRV
jgi:hypothetical protein